MKVFADAFVFLALLNKRDIWHEKSVEVMDKVAGPIVTTTWVLVEVADALSKPKDRMLIAELLKLIEADDRINVLGASDLQYQNGVSRFLDRPDKSWSLTDCISFVVAEQHNIQEVLTGDHHFAQAGFVPLLSREL